MTALRMSRAFRSLVALKVEVRGARRLSWKYTHDLSVDGLCISGLIRPDIDERLGVTLFLPNGFQISLPAEVRWVKGTPPQGYAVGAEFVHTLETQKALQKLTWEIDSGVLSLSPPPRSQRPVLR